MGLNMNNIVIYYIECTCIREVKFPNTKFHVGDVLYYNGNASSNEMYLYNNIALHNTDYDHMIEMTENTNRYKALCNKSHLPFTRQKKNARKYKKLKQVNNIKTCIESRGDLKCEIKEIKVIYTEEYL